MGNNSKASSSVFLINLKRRNATKSYYTLSMLQIMVGWSHPTWSLPENQSTQGSIDHWRCLAKLCKKFACSWSARAVRVTMIRVSDRFADFDISRAACERQFIQASSYYARLDLRLIQVATFSLLSHRISSNFNNWRSCGIHAEYDYEIFSSL